MKTSSFLIICLLFVSCATIPVDTPPHDCVILSPHDNMPIVIKKGFFNDMSKHWTLEEFQNDVKKYYEKYQKKMLEDYLNEKKYNDDREKLDT